MPICLFCRKENDFALCRNPVIKPMDNSLAEQLYDMHTDFIKRAYVEEESGLYGSASKRRLARLNALAVKYAIESAWEFYRSGHEEIAAEVLEDALYYHDKSQKLEFVPQVELNQKRLCYYGNFIERLNDKGA